MDSVAATPTRLDAALAWEDEAEAALETLVAREPILVRISAAKHLRDAAERTARGDGAAQVELIHLTQARQAMGAGRSG
jgi:chlorophyllide a reductase subunit Z